MTMEIIMGIVNNIINKYDNRPDVRFAYSGTSIEIDLIGGSYLARNAVESHFTHSRKYKHVSILNSENKTPSKKIIFDLRKNY
jgi:hypothetical protein